MIGMVMQDFGVISSWGLKGEVTAIGLNWYEEWTSADCE